MNGLLKFFVTGLFVLSFFLFFSQEQKKSVTAVVYVTNIEKADLELTSVLRAKNISPKSRSFSDRSIKIEFPVLHRDFDSIVGLFSGWGYVANLDIKVSYDFRAQEEALFAEKNLLLEQKDNFNFLIAKSDSLASKETYFYYYDRLIETNNKIAEIEKDLTRLQLNSQFSSVALTLKEEKQAASDYNFSWINMPGIEYSLLFVESPAQGFTSSVMQGIMLKYLFNTSKSYGILGIYKNALSQQTVDDLFLVAYGQDFYSRKLGRGQRKFFNLYTSFNLGVYILNGDDFRSRSWFMNPFVGVELVKTKQILVDTKVGYFLPYKDNSTMRGLLSNFSFNFLF